MSVKRQQGKDLESHVNTRQDRNLVISGGGTLTWDSGVLEWTNDIDIMVPGLANGVRIVPASISGVDATTPCLYAVVDRTNSTQDLTLLKCTPVAAVLMTDTCVVLARRGDDGKLYFRNGAIFENGDSKSFGRLNPQTDRSVVEADGSAVVAVGFNYEIGTNQLAVYVGGLMATPGVHYTETGVDEVTFVEGYVPESGEPIIFINIIGGEGPPGPGGSLQDAYNVGAGILAPSGTPVQLTTADASGTSLLQVGHASDPGGLAALEVQRRGFVSLNGLRLRSGTDFFGAQHTSGHLVLAREDTPYKGVRIRSDGAQEFGNAGPSPSWNGPLAWKTFTGTTHASTATTIVTGITTILQVLISIEIASNVWVSMDVGNTSSSANAFFVHFNASTGVVTIGASAASPNGAPGTNVLAKAYKLVVLHS